MLTPPPPSTESLRAFRLKVSLPVPPTAWSTWVPYSMKMFFTSPATLLNVPSFRFTMEPVPKPDRSSVLLLPVS